MRQFVIAPRPVGQSLPRTPLVRAARPRPQNGSRRGNDARHLTPAERRQTAFDLRLMGHSMQDIADAIGVSYGRVSEYIQDAMADLALNTAASAERVRAMECERLNRLLLAHWNRRHDPPIAALLVKILERLHKIQGLEVTKHEVSGPAGGPVPIAVGAIDISRLSEEEVNQLENIVVKACAALPAPPLEAPPVREEEEEAV